MPLIDLISVSPEVSHALKNKAPVVALESTVITHGLPRPQNLQLARDMEAAIRREGATPATIGVVDGRIRVGLTDEELVRLANARSPLKVSQRDFAAAILKKADGGTTVAGTLFIASHADIPVFATGGIGGVHKENPRDISNDLRALSMISMIVVCAGAKSILDLPATLEYLETMGVPVVGYKTDEFPAFYSRESGLKVSVRFDSVEEIRAFAKTHWSLVLRSAVLVANPIPEMDSIPNSQLEPMLAQASREAQEKKIRGGALTPFLLQRLNELTNNRSLRANTALLLNNARLAAQIAKALAAGQKRREI
jgi:pseudouridine-5'-phosphate glycosidase